MGKPKQLTAYFHFSRTFKTKLDDHLGFATPIATALYWASLFWDAFDATERSFWKQRVGEIRVKPEYAIYRTNRPANDRLYEQFVATIDKSHNTIAAIFAKFNEWYP
jgi:hypothetical protein